MKRLSVLVLAVAVNGHAAVLPPAYGCDSPEARQFDFWVGEWDLAYVENGKAGTSHNRVTKILDGCVLLEEFSGAPSSRLDGRSVSTFDRATRQWKQTWVDNTASYLDFTGGWTEGRMVLTREAEITGRKFLQRMVYEDIRAEGLKWLWQRSDDGGKTWTTGWEIAYKRVK
jgi:hypothetical protein